MNAFLSLSRCSLIFLWCLVVSQVYAQRDYKWEDSLQPTDSLPAIYLQHDAVIIYDYEERQTRINNGLFFARNILKRRVKILTQRGLDRYGKIIVPKKRDLTIRFLDTRTIKQDGRLVDHAASDIKSIDLTDEANFYDQEKYFLFSVPGLEVGDEFELVCIYEGATIQRGGNIYLHDFLPTLKSSFVLDVDKKVIVLTNTYNDMPAPVQTQGLDNIRFSWTMKDLPGLYDDHGIIPALQLPYFIYELNLNRFYTDAAPPNIKNWRDLLRYVDQQSLSVRVRKTKKLSRLYKNIIGDPALSPLEKLKRIHQFINREIRLQRIPPDEESQGIEYFIEEKKADYYTLLKMYKALLDRLGLKYYLASCKNRYQGPVQLNFPSTIQITDYTFVVEDQEARFHLVFPKTPEQQYEMGEIPPFLEGTSIFLLDLQDQESFKEIKIPLSPYQHNKRLHKIKTMVNLSEKRVVQNWQESLEGAASTLLRSTYHGTLPSEPVQEVLRNRISQRLPHTQLDSLRATPHQDQFPFTLSLDYAVAVPGAITKLDEELYKINIEDWFPHQLYQSSSNTRLLHYHPLFTGIDAFSYYLSFEQPVQLLNKSNIDNKVENELGTYELSIHQINEKVLVLRSKYILKKHKILNTEMQQLGQLNKAVQRADQTDIILQLAPMTKE